MLDWLKFVVAPPEPAGPAQTFKRFDVSDSLIVQDDVTVEVDAWRIDCPGESSVPLFELELPEVENCLLTYRGDLKTEDAAGKVYLEMWCRFPGRGEFFSKGVDKALKGTNDWGSYEVPFYLTTGQKPDLIKLNIAAESEARVWVKNLELLYADYG
jgi:hypothetical protein